MTLKAALLALTVPFAFALPAMACSCVSIESAEKQLEQSNVAFVGHVIDTGPMKVRRSLWDMIAVWKPKPSPYEITYVTTFQVDRMLKGPDVDTVQFTHMGGAASSMCGIGFQPLQNGVFLGYGSEEEGYSVSLCSMPQFTDDDLIAAASRN